MEAVPNYSSALKTGAYRPSNAEQGCRARSTVARVCGFRDQLNTAPLSKEVASSRGSYLERNAAYTTPSQSETVDVDDFT